MEYFDSFIESLGCKLTGRVVMVKSKILCYLVEAYTKDKWIYKLNDTNINYVKNNKVNTNNLEHFKLAINDSNFESLSDLQTECYNFLINYVEKYKYIFENLYKIIGLDTFSIDFLPLTDGPIILECGIKQGLSDYKLSLIYNNINNKENSFIHNYMNDNIRNNIIFNNLFSKEIIYCDIDNTICNNTKRILKYFKNNIINFTNMTEDDILNDDIIQDSVKYLNLLSNNYDIKFISARNRLINGYNITKKWLDKHQFQYSELILVNKLSDKFDYLKNKKFLTLIDDFKINYENDNPTLATYTISLFQEYNLNIDIFNNNWKELYFKYKN